MGRGKKEKNAKHPAASKPMQSTNIVLPESIYREELQHVIACAIVEAEKIKAQEEEKRQEAALLEWHTVIGYKKYDKRYKNAFNRIKVFLKILFLPERYIKGNSASTVLMKSFILLFFWAMKWFSLLLAVGLVAYLLFMGRSDYSPWWLYLYFVCLAFISFVYSRLFRMASIESDKIDDRNYLFGLFASITSFVSMIVAVIAVIKGA